MKYWIETCVLLIDVNIGSFANRNNYKYQRFKIILTSIVLAYRMRYSDFNP